jgi:hypothetical protein
MVVFGGQWNAPTSLKNCPSAKAYFLELLRLSSTPHHVCRSYHCARKLLSLDLQF